MSKSDRKDMAWKASKKYKTVHEKCKTRVKLGRLGEEMEIIEAYIGQELQDDYKLEFGKIRFRGKETLGMGMKKGGKQESDGELRNRA